MPNEVVTEVPGGVWVRALARRLAKHLMQSGLIAPHDDGLVGQVQRPLVVGSRNMGIADGVDDEAGQVDLFVLQRSPGVQTREQQHVLDESCHPLGFGLHATHRMRDVVGQIILFALCQFGVAADRGKWRAQFVAGVGDELPYSHLAGVPRRQGSGDAVEHPVQCGAELADLGVRTGRIDFDDGRGQPYLTPVEFEIGHLPGGSGNP